MESDSTLYPNFSTQDSEFEHFDEVSQNGTKKNVRGSSFSVEENRMLISGWLNTGLDPIHGNDQKLGTFWERITGYYHQYRDFESDRTEKMLTQRWGKIQKHVNKFSGCFAAINERNESGKTEQDKIADAKNLYEAQEKVRFNLDHAWILLRYQPKWIQLMQELANRENKKKKSSKRGRTNTSSSSTTCPTIDVDESPTIDGDESIVEEPDLFARPPGKKVEKLRLKETNEQLAKIQQIQKEKIERDEKKYELLKEKVEADKEKVRVKKEEVRVKKFEAEMKLITMDTSFMAEEEREYFSKLKMKVLQGGI